MIQDLTELAVQRGDEKDFRAMEDILKAVKGTLRQERTAGMKDQTLMECFGRKTTSLNTTEDAEFTENNNDMMEISSDDSGDTRCEESDGSEEE
jgi:hypothetical protein